MSDFTRRAQPEDPGGRQRLRNGIALWSGIQESLSMSAQLMGIPLWACYAFGACFMLLLVVLLLDYFVIRRNALGNTCCLSSDKFAHTGEHPIHQKRSTNILLSV
ncbi:hypothetical protein Tcan_12784 [Toxocara canis]|uniref:Uncharacterized protein n=1 Tax=Toxocara canis TaxID=6265 RepID=A0A0B2UU55_TOXCA|nr:hypothetical protein Tcan_12784 [Toxocara canis]